MAGLFGIGGSAAKTDRKNQLQSWANLQSMFGPNAKAGLEQTAEGAKGLSTARNYFEGIASGDPAKMSAVLAPQITGIKQQTGQAVGTLGQFAGRSGGTAAAGQQLGIEAQRAIQNLFDILGPEAAKELADISGAQESFGLGQQSLAESATATAGAQASGARSGDVAQQNAQQGAIVSGALSLFGL